ncbi:MAG: hypothetical protein NTZ03_13165 [Actinobacteria bacterium]|nr:hypothetical protein [Actinomycetota bacterium]
MGASVKQVIGHPLARVLAILLSCALMAVGIGVVAAAPASAGIGAGTPVAGTPTVGAPVNATGVVTGTAAFTDPVNRTLSYSVPATSTGGATLSIDSGTGEFTYTPTQVQRQAA